MTTEKAWLVVNEGASVYECEGNAPSGDYGTDWIVLRASDWAVAQREGAAVLWSGGAWEDHGVMSHERALDQFESAGDAYPRDTNYDDERCG